MNTGEVDKLAQEFAIDRRQVTRVIHLLDQDNTVWFIARYRKEQTGQMDERTIQRLATRLEELRALQARRLDVLRLLEAGGHVTRELARQVQEAETMQRLDDLYRPFRPKRRTRADAAREKGLVPLARMMANVSVPEAWSRECSLEEIAENVLPVTQNVDGPKDALEGARDIVAAWVSDDADVRDSVRSWAAGSAVLTAEEGKDRPEDEVTEFDDYIGFQAPVTRLRPHQILALDRGEKNGVLRIRMSVDDDALIQRIERYVAGGKLSAMPPSKYDELLIERLPDGGKRLVPARGSLRRELSDARSDAIADGYRRLLRPAIEREVRRALTEKAHARAIDLFGDNLRQLLLQRPVAPAVIMGIDPGYRSGCNIAVVTPTGELVEAVTIYPHPPRNEWKKSIKTIGDLLRRHNVQGIALGNGTGSRDTERLIADVIDAYAGESVVRYTIVNEAGASVYSASDVAREEFPDVDVTLRGAISIARRLQDPLAELVKIDPRSIGVGLYQHDVDQTALADSLDRVVESCVNYVGVDVNTASKQLLIRVSGLSRRQAEAIVDYRRRIERFTRRQQLLDVPGIGPKTFEQAAGFLRVLHGDEPFDRTAIHPESYDVARALVAAVRPDNPETFDGLDRNSFAGLDAAAWAKERSVGLPTIRDMIDALVHPGRDPRDEFPPLVFRTDLLELSDVRPGMTFHGRVTNVVDFGAFVDIGLHKAGLVHISEMSNEYVRDPFDCVNVGDVVYVRVVSVDPVRERIGLSMRDNG